MSTLGLKRWALLLTFWVALHLTRAKAQDQTVSGNLTVTGTTNLQGDIDIEGDAMTFGTSTVPGTTGSTDAWQMLYTDVSGNLPSIIEFDAIRSSNIFKWQQNAGATPQLEMTLQGGTLQLYDSLGSQAVTLGPSGNSFASSLTVNGSDNEMPNQTLVSSASILTEGLADGRYVSSSAISIGIGTGNGISGPTIAFNDGTASGAYSAAIGAGTSASSNYAVALGECSLAEGKRSFATGYYATASAYVSTAMGGGTDASGNWSTAMGNITTASGQNSTAMGWGTTASGWDSTATGNGTTASGDDSTAVGSSTTASGVGSTAMGGLTIASGQYSTASGFYTTSSGYFSTAMGFYTTANGKYSTAIGNGVSAQAYDSFVVGSTNLGLSATGTTASASSWVPSDPLFEVGNGTVSSYDYNFSTNSWYYTPGAPSDALVVYKNGNAAIQGTLATGGAITAPSIKVTAPGGDIPMYSGN